MLTPPSPFRIDWERERLRFRDVVGIGACPAKSDEYDSVKSKV